MRFKMGLFLIIFTATPALANDLSIGQNGVTEDIMALNNKAATDGSDGEQWKKDYPEDQVKKKGSAVNIQYCLAGKQKGGNIIKALDANSTAYEAKMPGLSGDVGNAANSAYQNNEQNLHSLYQEWKNRNADAHCT